MKGKKILLIVMIVSVFLIGVTGIVKWLIYKGKIEESAFWDFMKSWGFGGSIALLVVILIIYLLVKFLDKTKGKDTLKEYVDTSPLITVFKELFILNTRVPHRYDYGGKNPRAIPLKPDSVQIKNTYAWNHKKTGIPFFMFELHSDFGLKSGINTCLVRLDLGMDWIKENWSSIIMENTPRSLFNLDERNFPLDTPQSEEARINDFRLNEMNEGATSSELKHIDRILPQFEKQSNNDPDVPDDLKDAYIEAQKVKNMEKMNKLTK